MKLFKIFAIVLVLGAFVLTGCNKPPVVEPTEEELRLAEIVGTWQLGSGTVSLDGDDRSADWAGFVVTFTDSKGFSSTNSFDENVWPPAGTWNFQGTTGTALDILVRSDGINVNITSISATSLTLTFDYMLSAPLKNGRVESIEGNWIFSLSK